METSKKKLGIYIAVAIAIVIIIVLLLKCCQQDNVASYFNQDDEGWQIIGDAQEGIATPNYHETEGNPGGYISANDDAAGGVWYWSAPEKFLGNKSKAYGKEFSFSLKQSSLASQFDDEDIVLVSGDTRIVFNTEQNPALEWTNYSVTLSEEAGWKINDLTGSAVSEEDFSNVLHDLTAIYIRGEFVVGVDTGGLDNVVLYLK